MAYQVNRYNGSFLVSVADGTIDSSTDIRFLGKNYAGYGQVQNENFLHLLENFSGASQPIKPISGQLWFDTVDRKIKVYDGIRFRIVGGSTSSNSPPTGLSTGEFWFDNLAQQLYCWSGSDFVLIGPENPSSLGETSVTSQVVKDENGNNHTIAKLRSGGQTVAVVSKDAFNLNLALLAGSSELAGFGRIKKGITLVDTNNDSGVSSPTSGSILWGTAQTAKNLIDDQGNLFPITSIVRTDSPIFQSSVVFRNGLSLGAVSDPKLSISLTDEISPNFICQTGQPISFKIRTEGQVRDIVSISVTGINPGVASQYRLGSETNKWLQVYADNISGNLVGSVLGNTTGTHTGNVLAQDNAVMINSTTKVITANTFQGEFIGDLAGNASTATNALKLNDLNVSGAALPNTVAIRDSSSNITAAQFVGIASQSNRLKIDNAADDSGDLNYKTAKTNRSPLSIAARDSAGNIFANIFNGTATAVEGADLAEKYHTDQTYDIGTVIAVGGEKEVTASSSGDRAIGVISGNPGLLMNSEFQDGTYIALKGRVPVKVIGKVSKGDRLVASDNGTAQVAVDNSEYHNVFAIALYSSDIDDIKLIESVII
jgi:hypothetical protein